MKRFNPKEPTDFYVLSDPRTSHLSRYRLVDKKGNEIESVNEFLDAMVLRSLSEQTLRTYAYALLSIWIWMKKASLSLEELTEAHLVAYVRNLHKDSNRKRPPAPHSINLRLLVARSFYRFHTNRELPRAAKTPPVATPLFVQPSRVGACPARLLGRPSFRVNVSHRLVVPLTREEVFRFFESFRTYRDLAIGALMLFCGLRSRELLALRTHDVNMIQGELRVRGKGGKDRVLPLVPYVRKAISAYLELERPPTKHDALFVNLKGKGRGKPMTPGGLREIFRYHRKRSGVHKANPHRLRHTFATDMVREGMSLPVLKRLMGHSNIEMTMRYVNLSAEDVREEFERAVRRLTKESPDGKSLPKNP